PPLGPGSTGRPRARPPPPPAVADAPAHRPLVRYRHRHRTHPVPASKPSAACFRAGRALLDVLTCAPRAHASAAPGWRSPRQPTADQAEPRTAALARPVAEPVIPARREAR